MHATRLCRQLHESPARSFGQGFKYVYVFFRIFQKLPTTNQSAELGALEVGLEAAVVVLVCHEDNVEGDPQPLLAADVAD